MVVPAKDVENASRELFEVRFHLSSKHLQNASFVYDESSDTYRVLPSSSVTSTVPQIKRGKKREWLHRCYGRVSLQHRKLLWKHTVIYWNLILSAESRIYPSIQSA